MKKIKSGKLNMDAVLKVLLLLGFSTLFFINVKSGTIHMYVHPRITSYIKVGIIVMLAMAMFQLKEIFKQQRKQVNVYQYLFFIIPLIMAFTLPAKEVNLGTVSFGNKTDSIISKNSTVQVNIMNSDSKVVVNGSEVSVNESNAPVHDSRVSDNESYDKIEPYSLQSNTLTSEFTDKKGNILAEDILPHDTYAEDNSQNAGNSQTSDVSLYANVKEGEARGLKLQDDIVVMDDSNFVKWVDEISNYPSKYEGKKVIVSGFVFKDKQFKSNEFVPARMMMTCCAADMSIVGLLAKYELASELKQDSWFKFSGTIANGEFNGKPMPIINIESAEKIEKPQYEYVYPY